MTTKTKKKPAAKLAIVSRQKWKAGKSAGRLKKAVWVGKKKTIRVHHTADTGPIGGKNATFAAECSYMRRIQAFHRDVRGYLDIGYNYLIMPSGRVFVGRGFEKLGAHTLNDRPGSSVNNHNDDPGVCFAGTFTKIPPTREAQIAFWQLKHELQARGVKVEDILPHKATFATGCCGDAAIAALDIG